MLDGIGKAFLSFLQYSLFVTLFSSEGGFSQVNAIGNDYQLHLHSLVVARFFVAIV